MTVPATCTATLLTPNGRGAVATIRIDGSEARRYVAEHLRHTSNAPITRWPAHRAVTATWRHHDHSTEDIVAFSPCDRFVEIHCHGGSAAISSIMRTLSTLGCSVINWPEWIGSQQGSITHHEAWHRLTMATTEATALRLLDQYHGSLDEELRRLRQSSALRHGDDRLRQLAESYEVGCHLWQPWSIALGGPPNAGKSSLLNRLLGYDRALVFDHPGTTRDVLRGVTALAGWSIELLDTAGWRVATEEIEQIGVQRGQSAWRNADYRLLVLDASEPASIGIAQSENAHLVVWNKIDLSEALEPPRLSRGVISAVSIKTGAGWDPFLAALGRLLPPLPPRGTPIVFTERQRQHLDTARRCLDNGDLACAMQSLDRCQFGDAWNPAASESAGHLRQL